MTTIVEMTGEGERMDNARGVVERVVSGFGFSLFCFAVWGGLTAMRARGLAGGWSLVEVVWLVYSSTIAVLFLVCRRPRSVTLSPVQWLVALVTSFSGLFFESRSVGVPGIQAVVDGLLLLGFVGSGTAALGLRRSYDFLPALRDVTTGGLYRHVRHPMYVASMVMRLAYLARHASMQNAVFFAVMVWLYVKRARYEEQIMRQDERYAEYMQRVKHRFLPGIY